MLGIFLDTETNGLNPQKHKIIEIAFKILDVNTKELKCEFQAIIYLTREEWEKSDPESLQVTNFTWEEIEKGQKKQNVKERIKNTFKEHNIQRGAAVFICQNPSFDRVFFAQLIDADEQESLKWPYHWLDLASMYWSKCLIETKANKNALLPWETGFTKDKIAKIFNLPSEQKPHRAMNGVNHLLVCYEAILGFPHKAPV